jgi:hypothetical protein
MPVPPHLKQLLLLPLHVQAVPVGIVEVDTFSF